MALNLQKDTICQYDPPIVVGLLLEVWEYSREQAATKKGWLTSTGRDCCPLRLQQATESLPMLPKAGPKLFREHTQTNGDPSRVHIADLVPH